MFQTGDTFPGDRHRERIRRYGEHHKLLRGLYDAAMGVEGAMAALGTPDYMLGAKGELLRELAGEIRVVANLPKVICKRLAGMVNAGLSITSDDQGQAQIIDQVLSASRWGQRRRQATYRALAYGNGILTPWRDDGGRVRVDQRDPWTWFPVINPYAPSEAAAHTFAWIVEGEEHDYLLQEIHEPGLIRRIAHEVSAVDAKDEGAVVRDVKLQRQVTWADVLGETDLPEEDTTGVDVPLVAVMQSWTDQDSIYGESLLSGNETLIYEVTSRLSQIARVLDKHADPKFTGPEDAMQKDPNTNIATLSISGSRYLPRQDKEDPPFEYISWDAQLEHAHQELERAMSLLCVQMDMSPDLLGLNIAKTANAAAEATNTLRIRSFSTIQAVEDHRAFQRAGLQEMAHQILLLSNVTADNPAVIKYGDPLPLSADERAGLVQQKRMAGVMSLETAVRELNPDMSPDEVGQEVERIQAEEGAMFNPGQA